MMHCDVKIFKLFNGIIRNDYYLLYQFLSLSLHLYRCVCMCESDYSKETMNFLAQLSTMGLYVQISLNYVGLY